MGHIKDAVSENGCTYGQDSYARFLFSRRWSMGLQLFQEGLGRE
jgi:hypothetical protein